MIKVERTYPAPPSLEIESKKPNGKYNCDDVVEQLAHDFNNKCYICGMDDLQDPQVEHLLPHKGGKYPERKYNWDNLFLSCGHCNSVKTQKRYDQDIIDCCKDDPEKYIDFYLENKDVHVIAKDPNNYMAVNTAQLVTDVFTLKSPKMREFKSRKRKNELTYETIGLYDALELYKLDKNDTTKQAIILLLKRKSRFAEFKRSYMRLHKDEYPEFIQYLK